MYPQPVNHQPNLQAKAAEFTPKVSLVVPISSIARSDRWLIHHRLHQLNLTCNCPSDGSLWVEIDNSVEAMLVWSVVQRFLTSRKQQIDWLERCKDSPLLTTNSN